jgi:hypothetical protein
MRLPEQASGPPVDELIKPDGLAARSVKGFARCPSGGSGDDSAEIRLLDQRVHVDAPHQFVYIDTVKQSAHVDASHYVVDVCAVQQSVHVDSGEQRVHVDPVEQRVHIDPVEQGAQVHPLQDLVDVDLLQQGVQVDQLHKSIHIQRMNEDVDYALRHALGERLRRVGHAFACRAQPVERVHGTQYGRAEAAGIIRDG